MVLRDQIQRELLSRYPQFQKRNRFFIYAHNVTFPVLALSLLH
jgi:hypothetical protein